MIVGMDRGAISPVSGLMIRTKGGNRPLSAFIVDMDNTLVDVKRRDYQSFLDTAVEFALPALDFQEFAAMRLNGVSSRSIGITFLSRHGRLDSLEMFLEARHSQLDRPELFQLDTLFPGTLDALEQLFTVGIPIVAATLRRDSELLKAELVRLGIRGYLGGILTAGDVQAQATRPYKPEYDCLCYYKGLVLKEAVTAYGLVVERTAFVSDTEFDIEAGAGLGLITVAVATGYGRNERLQESADIFIESAAGLPELLISGT